jgi:hypothetical protein|tara:strand:+ start:401 stop:679 length:279 start_codon:yes stop_codon:yes gene_type:complete
MYCSSLFFASVLSTISLKETLNHSEVQVTMFRDAPDVFADESPLWNLVTRENTVAFIWNIFHGKWMNDSARLRRVSNVKCAHIRVKLFCVPK